jgi:hypothetical protein
MGPLPSIACDKSRLLSSLSLVATYRPEFEGVALGGQTAYLLSLLHVETDRRHIVYPQPADAKTSVRIMLGFLSMRFQPGDVMQLDGAEYESMDDATLALRAYCRLLR